MSSKITVPTFGEKITVNADNSLNVPNQPIIPFIEGDGIGVDITPPMQKVVDAAVEKAYGGEKKIAWMEVFAGEKATKLYDKDTWLPDETMKAIRDYVISIKGPLTTPVGGGIHSFTTSARCTWRALRMSSTTCSSSLQATPGALWSASKLRGMNSL